MRLLWIERHFPQDRRYAGHSCRKKKEKKNRPSRVQPAKRHVLRVKPVHGFHDDQLHQPEETKRLPVASSSLAHSINTCLPIFPFNPAAFCIFVLLFFSFDVEYIDVYLAAEQSCSLTGETLAIGVSKIRRISILCWSYFSLLSVGGKLRSTVYFLGILLRTLYYSSLASSCFLLFSPKKICFQRTMFFFAEKNVRRKEYQREDFILRVATDRVVNYFLQFLDPEHLSDLSEHIL